MQACFLNANNILIYLLVYIGAQGQKKPKIRQIKESRFTVYIYMNFNGGQVSICNGHNLPGKNFRLNEHLLIFEIDILSMQGLWKKKVHSQEYFSLQIIKIILITLIHAAVSVRLKGIKQEHATEYRLLFTCFWNKILASIANEKICTFHWQKFYPIVFNKSVFFLSLPTHSSELVPLQNNMIRTGLQNVS